MILKATGVRRSMAAAILVVALTLPGAASFGATKDPLEVGVPVGLTGYLAGYDGQFVDGVKLGVDELNAKGGVDGHAINLHVLDNASNATTGVTVTNQLLNQFGVSVMLTGGSSAQNTAIEPILERAQVPQIVFSLLPPNPDWAFTVNLIDTHGDALGDALQIDYANQKLHAKKIALLYSQTPYGQGAAKFMTSRANALGMEVVYSQAIEPSLTDMTPQMSAVKSSGAQAVIDILTGAPHIVEGKAAAAVGLTVPLVQGDDDVPTHKNVATAYPNTVFYATAVQLYPNIDNKATKDACAAFINAYTKAGKSMATISGAAFGWDAVRVLDRAVTQAKSTKGPDIHAALQKVTVQGCNALYKFTAADHTGQAATPTSSRIAKFNSDGSVGAVFSEPNVRMIGN
jgi:ABC-type branched-subunit amino acid transport system substrate-binding protein